MPDRRILRCRRDGVIDSTFRARESLNVIFWTRLCLGWHICNCWWAGIEGIWRQQGWSMPYCFCWRWCCTRSHLPFSKKDIRGRVIIYRLNIGRGWNNHIDMFWMVFLSGALIVNWTIFCSGIWFSLTTVYKKKKEELLLEQ